MGLTLIHDFHGYLLIRHRMDQMHPHCFDWSFVVVAKIAFHQQVTVTLMTLYYYFLHRQNLCEEVTMRS
jgi:hypothetical protein